MSEETIGHITIAPDVLLTVVTFSALQHPGVVRLARRKPSRPGRPFRGKAATGRGVAVLVENGRVKAEVHVVSDGSIKAQELGASLQQHIRDALEEMVGMPVDAVYVYIEDVETEANHRTR